MSTASSIRRGLRTAGVWSSSCFVAGRGTCTGRRPTERAPVERLTEGENTQQPYAVSPDGKRLVHRERHPEGDDLNVLALERGGRDEPLLAEKFNELNADLSSDGLWLAYQSDASGRYEIYVRPFPNVEANLQQTSSSGGTRPLWARDGSELFYLDLSGR